MEWLFQLFEKITSFIPRIRLINPDEGGVRITLGSKVKVLRAGWYIYWPLIQVICAIAIMPQIIDVRCQSVLTADGVNMCAGGAIKYRVKDAGAAILKVQDYDETLQALSLGIISRYINSRSYDDCKDVVDIEIAVQKGVKEEARGWGLDIQSVFITDLGKARNLRLLIDKGILPVADYE